MLTRGFIRKVASLSDDDREELRKLLEVHKNLTKTDDRGTDLVQKMSGILGCDLQMKPRDSLDVWCRAMIVYQLMNEGFSTTYAGNAIGKSHSMAIHLHKKMQDALDAPWMYKDILPIWAKFQNSVNNEL